MTDDFPQNDTPTAGPPPADGARGGTAALPGCGAPRSGRATATAGGDTFAIHGSRCRARPARPSARPAIGWPPPEPTTNRRSGSPGSAAEAGQATAEYALVMLAAAALAGLLLTWASSTDGVGRLFDAVLDSLLTQV